MLKIGAIYVFFPCCWGLCFIMSLKQRASGVQAIMDRNISTETLPECSKPLRGARKILKDWLDRFWLSKFGKYWKIFGKYLVNKY